MLFSTSGHVLNFGDVPMATFYDLDVLGMICDSLNNPYASDPYKVRDLLWTLTAEKEEQWRKLEIPLPGMDEQAVRSLDPQASTTSTPPEPPTVERTDDITAVVAKLSAVLFPRHPRP